MINLQQILQLIQYGNSPDKLIKTETKTHSDNKTPISDSECSYIMNIIDQNQDL